MSVNEASGIQDSMSVEFTPGPVLHEPAMTIVELRTIVAMTTADWLRCGHDEEKLRDAAEHFGYFFRGTPTITTDVVVYNVERRFTVDIAPLAEGWVVTDGHAPATDAPLATFEIEAHARHYADRLEADPPLADA